MSFIFYLNFLMYSLYRFKNLKQSSLNEKWNVERKVTEPHSVQTQQKIYDVNWCNFHKSWTFFLSFQREIAFSFNHLFSSAHKIKTHEFSIAKL